MPEVKILPNRWIEPDRSIKGEEVTRSAADIRLMRDPENFYWLETRTSEGLFVSARKDLLLSEAEFSAALRQPIAMYRREGIAPDEYVDYYNLEKPARDLLAEGYKDAVKRERRSYFRQLEAVTAVCAGTMTAVFLMGEAPAELGIGFLLASAAAWVFKDLQTHRELRAADSVIKSS